MLLNFLAAGLKGFLGGLGGVFPLAAPLPEEPDGLCVSAALLRELVLLCESTREESAGLPPPP